MPPCETQNCSPKRPIFLFQGREILWLLRRFQHTHLDREKVLDVGCGTGFWLRQLVQWGARPANVYGIYLLEERIQRARELCPPGVTLTWDDASNLESGDGTFEIILQFTAFTSILDAEMKTKLANEMTRVSKSGGAILWYDFFVSNPSNPDVRGVTREEISQLFPGLSVYLKRVTLTPPLGRAVGPVAPSLYRFLSTCKLLCTHYLGFFRKP